MTRFPTFPTKLSSVTPSEDGSAPVSFLMTSLLVLVVFVGLLQAGLVLHSRNALTDVASEAARQGSRQGAGTKVAQLYAQQRGGAVVSVQSVDTDLVRVGERELLRVTIHAKYPLLGSFFTASTLTVTGRSVIEAP